MIARVRLLVASLGLLMAACETTGTSAGYQPYTAVYVDPAAIQGSAVCGDGEGALRSYVATLYDVTRVDPETGDIYLINDPSKAVQVASSPPTSCRYLATFSQVIPGHFYLAAVDAYDIPACPLGQYGDGCLSPAGGWSSGVRTMLVSSGTEAPAASSIASPRWQTRCGRIAASGASGAAGAAGTAGAGGAGGAGDAGGAGGAGGDAAGAAGAAVAGGAGASGFGDSPYVYDPEGPTEAVFQTAARLGGCIPLPATEGPASAVLRADALLGGLTCGKGAGLVARFEVAREGEASRSIDCGAEARFEGLDASQNYEFRVLAFESGSSGPRWGSRCAVRTVAGVMQPATCEPLSERGSVRLPGAQLCEGAASYRASVVGLAVEPRVQTCPGDLLLQGLAQGLIDVTIERRDATGALLPGAALCTAKVQPGAQVTAACGL